MKISPVDLFLRFTGGAVVIFLIAPLLVIIPMSFDGGEFLRFPPSELSIRWYEEFITNPEWFLPLKRSVTIAIGATLLATILGVCGAYGLLHWAGTGRNLIAAVFMLPLVISPVIIGVGQLFVFSHTGLNDSAIGVISSHAMLCFPVVFLFVLGGLGRSALNLENVACSLGAKRWYAFLRVTFPSILPSLAGGSILSFIISFDEAIIVLFITSHRTYTLPRQIFDGIRYDLDPTVAAITSTIVILWIVLAATLAVNRTFRI